MIIHKDNNSMTDSGNQNFYSPKFAYPEDIPLNKFAPRALHLSPRQDRGVLRRRKPKTARYADFKNTKTIMSFPRKIVFQG